MRLWDGLGVTLVSLLLQIMVDLFSQWRAYWWAWKEHLELKELNFKKRWINPVFHFFFFCPHCKWKWLIQLSWLIGNNFTWKNSPGRVSIRIVWLQPACVMHSHWGSLYGLEKISVYINLFIKAFFAASQCNLKSSESDMLCQCSSSLSLLFVWN